MATINGTAGNDTLSGTSGEDTINGLGGNDLFLADGGGNFIVDRIDGGAGTDSIEFRERATSWISVDFAEGFIGTGTSGFISFTNIERVVTGNFDDRLSGNAAAQTLTAQGGADTLWGAGGIDTLWGGSGADTFIFREIGTANADRISDWTSGSDKLMLDASVMSALGTNGNFAAGDARFWSSASGAAHDANDRIIFNTSTGQVFYDADGNGSGAAQLIATLQTGATLVATDIVVERAGQAINGTEGNDSLVGGDGNDTINGFGGNDSIEGRGGDDRLDGGAGNDWIQGTGLILGGDGDDSLETDLTLAGDTTVVGGAGNDWLLGYRLDGGDGNDVLKAFQDSAAVLDGGAGEDTFLDFTFDDTVDGGSGSDTLMVVRHGPLIANLASGTMTDKTGAASVQVLNIENLVHRDQFEDEHDDHTYFYDDYLVGSSAGNSLNGGGGADTLNGGAGNDTLFGWQFDQFEDVYTFDVAPGAANADLIVQFSFASGQSHIQLDLAAYAALGARGNFVSGDARFFAGSGVSAGQDSTDRIVYDTASGNLYYDADGNGAGAAQLIVTLQGAPTLAATDIAVIAAGAPAGTAGDDWMAGRDGYVNDAFNGGAGNDRFDGREGDDTIDGGIGNDTLEGGDGADLVRGGDGNDTLQKISELEELYFAPAVGMDTLDGGLGDDTYELGFISPFNSDPQHYVFNVTLVDAGGVDTVVSSLPSWTLGDGFENLTLRPYLSESFSDPLSGTGNGLGNIMRAEAADSVQLDGAGGNDTLIGDAAFNGLTGGTGADSFVIKALPTTLSTHITDFASGSDKIRLDATLMTQLGASGNFAAGDARFHAGATAHDVNDRVIWDGSTLWYDPDGTGSQAMRQLATLQSGATVVATDIAVDNGTSSGMVINGTAGNDTLSGGPGNDTINGLGGNDLFVAGANGGNDTIDGGAGSDSIEFRERATSGVTVDFATGTIQGGGSGTITFTGIERVVAGNFNDVLTGAAGSQTLTGQSGADTLWGAAGADTLWGGGGNDAFIFREMGTANADRVSDFTSASDKVQLDDSAFTSIGAAGNFASGDGRFWAAAGATAGHDANDRVIYNTSTGSLYYDADGSGSGAAQLIATFQGNPAIAATDIAVI